MANYLQPCALETNSYNTDKSEQEHASEPTCAKVRPGKTIDSKQQTFSIAGRGLAGDDDAQSGSAVCSLPPGEAFDAVAHSLVRTLELEPTDPSCTSVERMYEWCGSFGRVHCITQTLNSRLPRVTVTYTDSRDCQRAMAEFPKMYPVIAVECSSDEPDHDLTGAHPHSVPTICSWPRLRTFVTALAKFKLCRLAAFRAVVVVW
jgi:hypothetical protein